MSQNRLHITPHGRKNNKLFSAVDLRLETKLTICGGDTVCYFSLLYYTPGHSLMSLDYDLESKTNS